MREIKRMDIELPETIIDISEVELPYEYEQEHKKQKEEILAA